MSNGQNVQDAGNAALNTGPPDCCLRPLDADSHFHSKVRTGSSPGGCFSPRAAHQFVMLLALVGDRWLPSAQLYFSNFCSLGGEGAGLVWISCLH